MVYGLADHPVSDPLSRVNGFAHVNHSAEKPRIGILLCINGAGSQYAWARKYIAQNGLANISNKLSYRKMEELARTIPVGSDGLRILPFGNGAERMLGNKNIGAHICGLHFNRHTNAHIYRAALEGIAFSFVYGMHILKNIKMDVKIMRAGNDNLFRSDIFSQTISNLMGSRIELIETTGAVGAAKAAGVAAGIYNSISEAMQGLELIKIYEPENKIGKYMEAYELWEKELEKAMLKS